jgi:hypothetical protein
MSEYQYYEFVAVDRPLDERQIEELRALSSRAQITPVSFVNTYNWGDFRGDPRKLMERCFDAFLYLANWGTRQLMFRLPRRLLSLETARQYCAGDDAEAWAAGDYVIVDLVSRDEDGDWEHDGEGWLASIIPVRAALAAGDLRPLYLMWLLSAQAGDLDEDETEPPVPPGLGDLSASLTSMAEFLRIDDALLSVAATASIPNEQCDSLQEEALAQWVAGLPTADKDTLILRLAAGDDAHLRAELLHRFRAESLGEVPHAGSGTRTVGELLSAAADRRAEQARIAAEQQAAERARRERAAAEARERRLEELARQGEQAWQRVSLLISTKKQGEYDAAVQILVDLRALSERQGNQQAFGQRIGVLRAEHQRKPSLMERFDKAGLTATPGR